MELVKTTKEPLDRLAVSIDQLAAAIERSLAEKAELLAALKLAREWIDPDERHLVNRDMCRADLVVIDAAIAHAEGTAP